MAKESHYSRITEAETMIKALQEKYPDVFWAVKPDTIIVEGIDNKQRSESAKKKAPFFMKLKTIKGSEKAIFIENNISVRTIIETYWDEWNDWDSERRQAMLSNELVKISPDAGKVNAYDCTGFRVLMDVFGVGWDRTSAKLPNILVTDADFDLDMRPGLDVDDDPEANDEIPEPEDPEESTELNVEVVEVLDADEEEDKPTDNPDSLDFEATDGPSPFDSENTDSQNFDAKDFR